MVASCQEKAKKMLKVLVKFLFSYALKAKNIKDCFSSFLCVGFLKAFCLVFVGSFFVSCSQFHKEIGYTPLVEVPEFPDVPESYERAEAVKKMEKECADLKEKGEKIEAGNNK